MLRRIGYSILIFGSVLLAKDTLKKGIKAFEHRDGSKAIAILQPLASNGVPKAQWYLGQVYYEGSRLFPGIQRDTNLAWNLIKKAAINGDPEAQYFLGTEYSVGTGNDGIPKDPKQGFDWFQRGADQGDCYSLVALGNCYLEGRGCSIDFQKAFSSFHKAALKGDAAAMTWIGKMYRNGQGVLQDYVEAHAWFNLAASRLKDSGNFAAKERDALTSQMSTAQIEKAQARAKLLASKIN